MIKAKIEQGGSWLTTGKVEQSKLVLDAGDVLRALHVVAERYGVSAQDLATNELALKVAIAREPELQLEIAARRKTKPTFWTPTKQWRLWFDVRSTMRENPGRDVGWCIKYRVRTLPHWVDVSVTKERFYEARRSPFGQMMERMVDSLGIDKALEIFSELDWEALP